MIKITLSFPNSFILSAVSNQEIEPTAAPEVEAPEVGEGGSAPLQAPVPAIGASQPQAPSLNSNNNAIQQTPANNSPSQQTANNNNGFVQVPTNIQPPPPKTIEVVVRDPVVANKLPGALTNNNGLSQAPANYIPAPKPIDSRFSALSQAPLQGQVNRNPANQQVSSQRNVDPQARLAIGSQASASVPGNAGAQQQMATANTSGPQMSGTIDRAPETEPAGAAQASTGMLRGHSAPAQPGPMQPIVSNLPVNNAGQVAPWVYTPMIPGSGPGIQNANTGRGFQSFMPGGEVEAAEAAETQAGPFAMSGPQMGQVGFVGEMESAMPQASFMASVRGLQQPMGRQMAMSMPQAPFMATLRGLQQPMGGQTAMSMPQGAVQAFPGGGLPAMRAINPGVEIEPPQVQPQEIEPAEGTGAMMGNMMAPNRQLVPGAPAQTAGQQWSPNWATGNNFAWNQPAF